MILSDGRQHYTKDHAFYKLIDHAIHLAMRSREQLLDFHLNVIELRKTEAIFLPDAIYTCQIVIVDE